VVPDNVLFDGGAGETTRVKPAQVAYRSGHSPPKLRLGLAARLAGTTRRQPVGGPPRLAAEELCCPGCFLFHRVLTGPKERGVFIQNANVSNAAFFLGTDRRDEWDGGPSERRKGGVSQRCRPADAPPLLQYPSVFTTQWLPPSRAGQWPAPRIGCYQTLPAWGSFEAKLGRRGRPLAYFGLLCLQGCFGPRRTG